MARPQIIEVGQEMSKDPAFLFYPSDFLTGTMFFTNEDIGLYIKLLCAQHQQNGSINKKVFDSMVGEDSPIRGKFIEDSEGYYNQRMLDEMIKRKKKSDNLSANALKRWNNVKQKECKSNAIASNLNMPTKDRDRDINKDIDKKHKYGVYKNVLLKDKEIEKLKEKFGDKYTDQIEMLSEGLELKGYTYKSHYLAILKWSKNSKIDIERKSEIKLSHNDVLILFNGKYPTPPDKDIWNKVESIKENDKTYWVYK